MHLLQKQTARLAALVLFTALPLGLSGCHHDMDNCTGPGSATYPGPAGAGPALRGAGRFAILAGTTVTNTGASTIVGDIGVSPGSAIVGIPGGQPTGGAIHANDGVASQGQTDLTTVYNDLAGRACNVTLSGVDLGGRTLTGGVYCFATSAQLTGTLTLDGQGNTNTVFVFKIGSTLTTSGSSAVVLINGAQARNVYWQVGSSATIGNNTAFQGNIVALTSITLDTGASVDGRTLARAGAVTMDTNDVALP